MRCRDAALLGVGALVVLAVPAGAYLDPGTASLAWQVLVSSLLGAALALKLFWRRLVDRFRGRKAKAETPPEPAAAAPPAPSPDDRHGH